MKTLALLILFPLGVIGLILIHPALILLILVAYAFAKGKS